MTTPLEFSSSDLLVLRQQLADLRRRHSGQPRLPAAVWEAAAEIAQQQGPWRVGKRPVKDMVPIVGGYEKIAGSRAPIPHRNRPGDPSCVAAGSSGSMGG